MVSEQKAKTLEQSPRFSRVLEIHNILNTQIQALELMRSKTQDKSKPIVDESIRFYKALQKELAQELMDEKITSLEAESFVVGKVLAIVVSKFVHEKFQSPGGNNQLAADLIIYYFLDSKKIIEQLYLEADINLRYNALNALLELSPLMATRFKEE
jgi:RNase H-fold protein (predicted Holliday junction resolvase)